MRQSRVYIPPHHVQDERASSRRTRPAKAEKCDSLLDCSDVSSKGKRLLFGSGDTQLSAWVYQEGERIYLYETEMPNTDRVTLTFRRVSHAMWLFLENDFIDEVGEGHNKTTSYNFSKMHLIVIRWLLKEWTLPIELKRLEDGQLTDESFKQVCAVHPHLLAHFLQKYVDTLFTSDGEREKIARQSALLFSPNSKGVNNACDTISLYCTLSGFWEKFGLNYFDLQKLPHDVFLKLRTVMSFESDMRQRSAASAGKKQNNKRGRSGGGAVTTSYSRF